MTSKHSGLLSPTCYFNIEFFHDFSLIKNAYFDLKFKLIHVCFLLVVEFIEVLHVSKNNVLFVDDSWRNLLNPTGHLPQVSLRDERIEKVKSATITAWGLVWNISYLTSMHSLRSRTYAFSVWISSAMMNLDTKKKKRRHSEIGGWWCCHHPNRERSITPS